jgi:hypothetical protein
MSVRFKSSVILVAALLLCNVSGLYAGDTPVAGFLPTDKSLQAAADKCQQPEFKKYLAALKGRIDAAKTSADPDFKKELDREAVSALMVADDIAASQDKRADVSFAYYAVPPMSNIKRLTHTYPEDGKLSGSIRIVAAKGEFEPASFVIYPFADAGKVELKVSDLVGKNGKIPASAVDVKIIKIWYQAGTAWYSYYADKTGRELVPELLLNDENLVKVDMKGKDNYLRVDYPQPRGPEYVWISNPANIDVTFNDNTEPVRDAKTLQPFSLTPGEFKQIWLTFEAPKTAEGKYSGTISITVDGKVQSVIPIEVRVLPFELPDPKTNYDLTREYYTSIYNKSYLSGAQSKKNGGGQAPCYTGGLEAERSRLFNEYVNMRKHNVLYPQIRDQGHGYEKILAENLEIYKKAGLRTDTIIGAISANDWQYSGLPEVRNNPLEKQPVPADLIRRMDLGYEVMRKAVGHSNIYCIGADEPSMARLVAERKPWRYIHDKGLKTFNTGNDGHLTYGGYNEDFVNYGGSLTREAADKWHAFGGRMTSYANPHTGPENPDFARRAHGMELYQANADGTCNFILNWYTWNDFTNADENIRGLNMIYPGVDAPIDTMEWEGFREGIDDIRYATLLKQLANKAIATGKTENVYKGRMALQWLALLDSKKCDLNAMRLEMISYILKLM